MRKLIYDCYFNNVKMKTVSTFTEAKDWEKQNNNNRMVERLVDWTDEKKETKEEKEKRITIIHKRIKAIKEKKNLRKSFN